MTERITIPEPWPIGLCAVCGLEKEIVATARRSDRRSDDLCCEDCFEQLPARPDLRVLEDPA